MTRWNLVVTAGVATVAALSLSACGETAPPAEPAVSEAAGTPSAAPGAGPAAPATVTSTSTDGVPPFARPYPGARLDGEPLNTQNETERGGVITFTTADSPDAVIEYYRGQAEAAGLASAMTMTQGDTQVYGAQAEGSGASVRIVATPLADSTSVQLTWNSGG